MRPKRRATPRRNTRASASACAAEESEVNTSTEEAKEAAKPAPEAKPVEDVVAPEPNQKRIKLQEAEEVKEEPPKPPPKSPPKSPPKAQAIKKEPVVEQKPQVTPKAQETSVIVKKESVVSVKAEPAVTVKTEPAVIPKQEPEPVDVKPKVAVDGQIEKVPVKVEEKEVKGNAVAQAEKPTAAAAAAVADEKVKEGDRNGDGDGEPPSKVPRLDDDTRRAEELEKTCPYVIFAHNVPKLAKVNDMYQNLEGYINLQERKVKLFFKTEEARKKVLFDPPVFPNLKVNYTTEPQFEMYVVGIPCEIPKNDVSKELSDALSAKGVYYVSVVRGFGQKNLGHAVLRLMDESSKTTLLEEKTLKLFNDTDLVYMEEEEFKKKFAVSVSNLHVRPPNDLVTRPWLVDISSASDIPDTNEKFAKDIVVDLEKKLEELGAKDSGMLLRFPNIEIYFTKEEDATKALELNGMEINARSITTRRLSEKSFRMIITGLGPGVRENHLREIMEGINVLALEMRKTGTYVEVPTEEDRQKLLALHQIPVEGKRIMVLYDEPSFYQPLAQEKRRKKKKKKPDVPGLGIYRGSSSRGSYRGGPPRGGGGGGGSSSSYYRNTPNWGGYGGPPAWQGFNNSGFHVQDNYNYYGAQGGYGGGSGYRSGYPDYGYRGGGGSSGMGRGYGRSGSSSGYMRGGGGGGGGGGGSRGYSKRGSGGSSGRGYRGNRSGKPFRGTGSQNKNEEKKSDAGGNTSAPAAENAASAAADAGGENC